MTKSSSMNDSERYAHFLSQSIWNGGCLIFQGHRGMGGYGVVRIGSRTDGTRRLVFLHRWIYEYLNGSLTDEKPKVLHSCDRGADGCITPEHLMAGTQLENVHQCRDRGRLKLPTPPTAEQCVRGSECGAAKLTEDQVIEIRQRYVRGNGTILGKEYGVNKITISRIIRRINWTHV